MFLVLFTLTFVNGENPKNFTHLNYEINDASKKIALTDNYTALSDDDKLYINKQIEIEGNNITIDLNNLNNIINITNNSKPATLKNINFKNLNTNSLFINNESSLIFINCTIDDNKIDFVNITLENQSYIHHTDNISSEIKKIAKKIVKDSEDIDALKKIAKWISKNIDHEKAVGFYQTPLDTLKRKKGNCCCHAELFYQLCASLGYTEKYKIYILHVGSMTYGQRHFLNIVDNICVDTEKTRPWGNGKSLKRTVYSICEYPYLPLIRQFNSTND